MKTKKLKNGAKKNKKTKIGHEDDEVKENLDEDEIADDNNDVEYD